MILKFVQRIYVAGEQSCIRHRDPNEAEEQAIRTGILTVIGVDEDQELFMYHPDNDEDGDFGKWKELPAYHD